MVPSALDGGLPERTSRPIHQRRELRFFLPSLDCAERFDSDSNEIISSHSGQSAHLIAWALFYYDGISSRAATRIGPQPDPFELCLFLNGLNSNWSGEFELSIRIK